MGQRSQPPHSSPSTHLAAGHRAGDVIWRPLSPTISHEDAATDCRRIRHPGRGVHRPAWTYLASTHGPPPETGPYSGDRADAWPGLSLDARQPLSPVPRLASSARRARRHGAPSARTLQMTGGCISPWARLGSCAPAHGSPATSAPTRPGRGERPQFAKGSR